MIEDGNTSGFGVLVRVGGISVEVGCWEIGVLVGRGVFEGAWVGTGVLEGRDISVSLGCGIPSSVGVDVMITNSVNSGVGVSSVGQGSGRNWLA